MYHANKTRRKYKKQHENNDSCPFCSPQIINRSIKEFTDFIIVENGVKYDYWEGHKVLEHLLLLPKKHIKSLSELSLDQNKEMTQILATYENLGYSIYARGLNSPRRSVEHQHTHLILISKEGPRALLFLRKPYFLFKI